MISDALWYIDRTFITEGRLRNCGRTSEDGVGFGRLSRREDCGSDMFETPDWLLMRPADWVNGISGMFVLFCFVDRNVFSWVFGRF
jgi:hypothetical protein